MRDQVGQVRVNELYLDTLRDDPPRSQLAPKEWCECAVDPSKFRGWMVQDTPWNMRVLTLTPAADIHDAS
eukprot:3321057-Pyramimonas_sp.AAC.1